MLAFSLKKWIGALLQPLPLIILVMMLAILFNLRGHKKLGGTLQVLALFSLLLFTTPPLTSYLIKQVETEYPPFTESVLVDYIVVLGCGHNNNPNRSITSQLASCSLYRTTEGVRIYQENPNARLIFSGYSGGEPRSNAETNKDLAIALGVPASKIITEPRAKDTREEAMLLAATLKNKPFALVTSASHMPRALEFFRQQELYPLPAPTGHLYQTSDLLHPRKYLPNSRDLHKSEIATYEFLGKLWQHIISD